MLTQGDAISGGGTQYSKEGCDTGGETHHLKGGMEPGGCSTQGGKRYQGDAVTGGDAAPGRG